MPILSLGDNIGQIFGFLWGFIVYLMKSINLYYLFGLFIPFLFLGIWIKKYLKENRVSEEIQNAIGFYRFTFIFTLGFFLIMYYFFFYNTNPQFETIRVFLHDMSFRLYEVFSLFWVLSIVIGLIYIADFIEIHFLKSQFFKNMALKYHQKMETIREKRIIFYSLLIICAISNFTIFQKHIFWWNSYQDDELTEAVLWIGDYFYEHPLEEEKTIFVEQVDRNWLWVLFYDQNLNVEFFNDEMMANYSNFIARLNDTAPYVLININTIKSLSSNFNADFNILFQNEEYTFIELII